jgi:hypothetical protein
MAQHVVTNGQQFAGEYAKGQAPQTGQYHCGYNFVFHGCMAHGIVVGIKNVPGSLVQGPKYFD